MPRSRRKIQEEIERVERLIRVGKSRRSTPSPLLRKWIDVDLPALEKRLAKLKTELKTAEE